MNFVSIYKSVTSELVLEVGDFGEDLGVFGLCAQSRVGPSTDYLIYSTLACYQTANIGGLTRNAEMPLCKIFGLIAAFRERHLLVYTLLSPVSFCSAYSRSTSSKRKASPSLTATRTLLSHV